MSAPLVTLPPPPPGKTGWPWTVGSEAFPSGDWPRISIVTPSFNHGKYIEETIRSVLLQGYPNLEYVVLDGGSTDETVSILKKYEPWLTRWVSEKDNGQADAINRGWKRATGDVVAWLNSDDLYQPNALRDVALAFKKQPDADWLCGGVDNRWPDEHVRKRHRPSIPSVAECLGRKNYGMHQPGMFWKRSFVERVGPLDTSLNYSFCHDFWVRSLLQPHRVVLMDTSLAVFRIHPASKSCGWGDAFAKEDWEIFHRYADRLSRSERRTAASWLEDYEAENIHDVVYALLASGRKSEARRFVLHRLRLLPRISPRKVLPGLLCRALITGKAPKWFSTPGQFHVVVGSETTQAREPLGSNVA